jgi:arginase
MRQPNNTMKGPQYEILGALFDFGSALRGCAQAPRVLRDKGLIKRLNSLIETGISISDGGDVISSEVSESYSLSNSITALSTFSTRLMSRLEKSYDSGYTPVVIGGDHSISIPSVSAASIHHRKHLGGKGELGLIWVDAHPDLGYPEACPNVELHGMSVAKLRPENIFFIGLREVMACEKDLIKKHVMTAYTMTDIERLGIFQVCEEVFSQIRKKTSGFVVSFDIDACNPLEAPAVQYPEPGGLTYRESRVLMEYVAQSEGLMSLEMVEINPSLETDTKTSQVAIELIHTALGGSIV